jgi:hypothetical protein
MNPSFLRLFRPSVASLLLSVCALGLAQPGGHGYPHGHKHGAHVHGQAAIDLLLDGQGFEAELTIPLEVLVGFERAPRTPDEQAQLDRALAIVADPARMLRPSTAAGCSARPATVKAPDWTAAVAGADAHHDLVVRYRFECKERERLAGIEILAFEGFSRLRAVELRSVDERGARAQRLGRSARIAKLSR